MKTNWQRADLVRLAVALLLSASGVFAQGTAFTYQGQLIDTGNPANGKYDLQFQLYDASPGGNQVGGTISSLNQAVTNGLLSVTIDFGSGVFTGPARWLQVSVRTNGSSSGFVPLTPRQLLTPAPYAIYAATAGVAQTAASVPAANITPGGNLSVAGITATTGMTNLALTPSRLLGTDSANGQTSISVGSGLLLSAGTLSSTVPAGTVTSVGLSIPGFIIVNSPVTGAGTLTAVPAGPVLTNGQSAPTAFSNSVTISLGGSTTNHFGGANGFDSADGANFTNIPSSAIVGMGGAALMPVSAFDAAGAGLMAARDATNGLTGAHIMALVRGSGIVGDGSLLTKAGARPPHRPAAALNLEGRLQSSFFLSTNASVAIAGFSGVSGSGDQFFTCVFTNSGPADITVTLPAACLTRDGSRVYYVTNSSKAAGRLEISGRIYGGFSTSAVAAWFQ